MHPFQDLPKDRDPAHLEGLRGACRHEPQKTGSLEMEGQRVGFEPTCSFLQTDFDRRNQVVSYGLGRRLLAHQIGGKA